MIELTTPLSKETISQLNVGDVVSLSGYIYCGRDAVLPRICKELEAGIWAKRGIDLRGGVIFHTAVSPAGVGPTSSNKLEIEGTMETLSKAGVRMHLGKGKLKPETVNMLAENDSAYLVIPPVTALLKSKTVEIKTVAFDELGMEALHELIVEDVPAIVAAAGGRSIYD